MATDLQALISKLEQAEELRPDCDFLNACIAEPLARRLAALKAMADEAQT